MDGSDTSSCVDGIAIIGMSCRFPGARNIYEFWRNLSDGVESITFFSDQELRDSGIDPALINDPNYVKAGCVIEDIDLFDASFFGYSRKEAETIDPQQRLFLECAWKAIEDAGYFPQTYEGLIGVFGGTRTSSYVNNVSSGFQVLIGNDKDYITTRVSYKLNLRGPSVVVQTACSTSLVAVHFACESLQNGECDMALAGGAAITVPQKMGYLYQEGMILSPDGHCRAFDARAQGMIVGNGVGIVLLKRLTDALSDGDHIYAVIRGSAVNNDGWSKTGYTAPSLNGQVAVISEALAMTDVEPETISYIEAHGTGTYLGDPIEVKALNRVFRANTGKKGFCALGSVKTNIGHLDTAAGVAGLIKTVLALKYKQLPPSLHFDKPNPRIDFSNSPFFVNAKLSEWKADGYPRRAGVSSFGIGGTNAHVILEEAPAPRPVDNDIERPLHLMTLSARSENALKELARRYETFLETHPDALLADVCFTANVGRSHFPYRLAVATQSTEQLREQMAAFAGGIKSKRLVTAHVESETKPKVAFLFTGQGSQYVGMGQPLYYTQPTFRKALDRCAEILKSHLDRPLLSVIFEEEGDSSILDETAYTQPALFALEYALAETWRSWGIEPSVVMGHSVGEYVAACVAGVFSLEDGLKLIAARGRLIQALPQEGEMAAVFAGEERVAAAVAPYANDVSIAAINGPENVVITGVRKSVRKILDKLASEGVRAVQLKVSHPFHSPLMEPMLSPFEEIASQIKYLLPRIGLISNVTGQPVENNEVCEAGYWRRHVLEPVRFASGMKILHEQGYELFLEIGPNPVLLGMGRRCLPKGTGIWLPSLRKERDDWKQMLESLGELYVRGVDVDWSGFDQNYTRRRISLPPYPFERKRYWVESIDTRKAHDIVLFNKSETNGDEYPFGGQRLCSTVPIFEFRMTIDSLPSLKDHRIHGMTVMPAGAYWEMLFTAGRNLFDRKDIFLSNLTMHEAMILEENNSPLSIQVVMDSKSDEEATFNIFSLSEFSKKSLQNWKLHMSGTIRSKLTEDISVIKEGRSLEEVRMVCRERYTISDFLTGLKEYGIIRESESEWWQFEELWMNGKEVLGKIRFTENLMAEASEYQIHPSIIDPCFQILSATLLNDDDIDTVKERVFLPIGFDHVRYHSVAPQEVWCHAGIRHGKAWSDNSFIADFRLFDITGQVIAEIVGVHMRFAKRDVFLKDAYRKISYEVKWEPKEEPEQKRMGQYSIEEQPGCWVIFADRGGVAETLSGLLKNRGDTCVMIFSDGDYKISEESAFIKDTLTSKDYVRLFREKLVGRNLPCKGMIHLWSLDAPPSEVLKMETLKKSILLSYTSVVYVVQAIAIIGIDVPNLCLVTRGAQAVDREAGTIAVSQAPLWGLRKVIEREHPEINCLAIDLDPSGDVDEIQVLCDELYTNDHEREMAFRSKGKYVPKLVRSSIANKGSSFDDSVSFSPNGTYLLTGGLGGVGLETACWLIEHGARHIALINRNKATALTTGKLNDLKKSGAQFFVASVDVKDHEYLSKVINIIRESMPPLRGVFHLAGVLEEKTLLRQKSEDIERVMAPKVEGAWNMHLLTLDDPLDYFVLFSSISSLWGGHGLGGYTAANTFLDALAHYRRTQAMPALSVNWGAFSGVGMIAHDHNGTLLREKSGIGSFSPQEALSHLGIAFCKDAAQVCIAKIDWSKFLRQPDTGDAPFFSRMAGEAGIQEKKEMASDRNDVFLDQLRNVPVKKRRELLEAYLKQKIAEALHIDIEDITIDGDFIRMGMDSLIFLNLAQTISKDLQIKIVPHKLFEETTVRALAKSFAGDIEPDKGMPDPEVDIARSFTLVSDINNRFEPFDLTDIQQAYWVGRSGIMGMGKVACHTYYEIDIENLDLDRYTLAWQRVIERHEMLRAIVLPNGQQQILEHVPPYRIESLDLTGKKTELVKSQLDAVRQRMSHQVLETDQWPLFEIRASRLDERRIRLHFSLDLLLADVHSIRLMMREVWQYYSDPDTAMIPLEITFRDYILGEEGFRKSNLYHQSREYWIDRLPTLPMAPELPAVKKLSDLEQLQFVRRTSKLEPEIWLGLKQRASELGLTPSGVLMAAYAEILAAWSKSPHFTINLTIFNRLPVHPQINDIVGDFTSVTFLEVDNSGEDSFESRAINIQKQLWKDMDHRFFSGVQVLRELAQSKGMWDIMPVVFTSNLVYSEDNQVDTVFGIPGEVVYEISQTPQVWVDLQVSEVKGALIIFWDAVEELFPERLLDDMFDAYCNLLKRLADEEDAWQKTIRQLIPAVQLEKRATVNGTEAPISSEMLHTLFAAQARQRAKQAAVVSSNRTLSYEELSNRSNQVGRLLQEKGVQPNTLVAVVMEKSWEQVVAVLGILQSGAAYLPINPSVPKERLWHLLNDGEVNLILTQSWLEERLEWPENLQCFSVDKMELTDNDGHPLDPVQGPEDLAYVIYTSGSTGFPKGVMIDHQGAVNTILDVNQRFGVKPEDRVLALSNLNFDLSVYDIFGTLAAGATIIMPEATGTKDPAHWSELIMREQVTVWNSVPTLMQMLLEYASGRKELVPQSLRLVLLSGDWIPLELPDKIKTLVKDVQIISLGGATEASIWSNLYPIEEVNPQWKSIPYGRPMVNQRFYVLNEFMEDCPDWVTGQLYIGGIGLAKGYWRDEEKTRNSFIIHPKTKKRLYRTGDLGRYLPNGNIEFLGREDFQVKIRGYRIELGEIETILKQHPGVRDGVVTVLGDERGTKRLIGYVVSEEKHELGINELRSYLSEELPDYMLPYTYVLLDSLPLTANGKVDRKALPALDQSDSKAETTFVAPRTVTEKTLCDIWGRILEIEQPGIYDNFFMLGGDSLLATRLVFEIRKAFLIELQLPKFFEFSTVARLSQVIDDSLLKFSPAPVKTISIKDLNAEAEAVLGSDVIPENISVEHINEPAHIFLTGATGFLGCFLLHEFLNQTQADIYCLVRSADAKEARKRLQEKLGYYSLWDESMSSRIIPVVGDLSQPLFGLSIQQFQELASQIDVIYHSGAWTHFAYSYATLKPINVLGTQEVLRLATQVKNKPVHHISTNSVFPLIDHSGVKIIRENDDLVYDGFLYGGYPQSKWVGERLVRIANSRGLPVSIYRPGMITGHSQTGFTNLDDLVCRLIKGCIQIGYVPQMDLTVDILPVDFVSKSIVHLSSQKESLGKTFHLVNPNPVGAADIIRWLRSFGYSLEQVPYNQWREMLMNEAQGSQENALYPLLPMFPERMSEEQSFGQTRFEIQNAIKGFANSDIVFPSISKELLNTYLSHFIDIGFINRPI